MKPLLFLFVSLLCLQDVSAQDYLKSKFRTAEKVTIPFEHPAVTRLADPEYTYYIEVLNWEDGVCVVNVDGLDDWELPFNVCKYDHALGGYDNPASTMKVDVDASQAYDIVIYVNEYEWSRRSAPQTYMQHVYNVSALGGFDVIISIEPYTGDM